MGIVWYSPAQPIGTVALIHGAMASASTWWRVGPALAAAGWRVVAVDLPGHGGAPSLPGRFSFSAFAAQAAERLPRRVDLLVGHSLGAVVALTLAARPGFARAVVLEDPPDSGRDRLAQLARVIEADAELVARDWGALYRRTREANPAWSELDVRHAVDGVAQADVSAFLAALRTMPVWDLPALVGLAKVPVCLMTDRDRPPAAALRAVIADEFAAEFDGGHCIHRARPERWLSTVTHFATAALGRGGYTA